MPQVRTARVTRLVPRIAEIAFGHDPKRTNGRQRPAVLAAQFVSVFTVQHDLALAPDERTCKHVGRRAPTATRAFSDGLLSELEVLQTALADGLMRLEGLKTEKSGAAAMVAAAQGLLQAAAEEVAWATAAEAQSGQMAAAAAQQLRAELAGRKVSIEARLKDVASTERAVANGARLERELHDSAATAGTRSAQTIAAQRALEYATLAERLRQLADKQLTADRLLAVFDSARSKETEALAGLRAADQAQAEAIARRDSPDSGAQPEVLRAHGELDRLRAVELHLKTQSVHNQVRDLEAHEDRATRHRDTAFANRSKAS